MISRYPVVPPQEHHQRREHRHFFEYLVENIPDINEQNEDHTAEPILHRAILQGRYDIVDFLITAGAHINFISKVAINSQYDCSVKLGSPLHTAVYKQNTEIIHLLLDKGADVNCQSNNILPPLECSLYLTPFGTDAFGAEIAELLTNHGADTTPTFSLVYAMILCFGSFNCMFDLLKRRLQGVDLNKINMKVSDKHKSLLGLASSTGDSSVVNLLLESGADVNGRGLSEDSLHFTTALGTAAHRGHIKITELLLASGANVNAPQNWFNNTKTALSIAAAEGKLDMVQSLINAGADQHLPLNERLRIH